MLNKAQGNKKSLFCCVRFISIKRILAMVLVTLLFPLFLFVPVYADETDDAFIDLLDYGYATQSGSNNITVANGVGNATYVFPSKMRVTYVDVLFTHYPDYDVTSVEAYYSTGQKAGTLSVVHVSGSVYRAYGQITGVYANNLTLKFNTETTSLASTNLSILRFLVSPLDTTHVPIEGSCIINNGNYSETIVYRPTDKNNSRTFTWDTNSPIFLTLLPGEWLPYDFIEFNIEVYNTVSITSVSAMLDRQPLPVEVSYLNNGSADYEFNSITIRVDLRNAERTADGEVEVLPMIYLNAVPASGSGYVNVYGISAYVVIDEPSALTYWFTKVQASLNSIGTRINTFMTNTGTWFTDLGTGITNAISSAADRIVEAITGGENADDLKEGADQIGDAGSSLGDNIGFIQDFEDQYIGDLDSNMDIIISGGNFSGIVAPLSFVHRYTNMIVAGIPSNYLVIFTLPILLGIFMYIVGHPIKAPRPDTSGDIVTRETFTETTILSGPGAGRTRTTRTITRSSEIGREHNE